MGCEEDNGGCHEHARCIPTGSGTRRCECEVGYKGSGTVCKAVAQQCSEEEKAKVRCHSDFGYCFKSDPKDPLSKPQCMCQRGYFGNGKWCLEQNKCRSSNYGSCNRETQVCISQGRGSGRCECLWGYNTNGECETPSERPRVIGMYEMPFNNVSWIEDYGKAFKALLKRDF